MAQKHTLSPEQDKAANPSENVWVQANAGTGKTSVLVQRLLRILFRASDENGILCLTYTNAGAGEMRNRILAMLRKWACANDGELADMLYGITLNATPTESDLAHARNIFFKYIDNPDMLKIKTIHGFCEEILHRFPMEAGLSPAWSLVSDANQNILLQDAFDRLINSGNQDERTANAFAHIVERISEYSMPEIFKDLTSQYKTFFNITNFDKYREYFIETTKEFLKLNTSPQIDISTKTLENIIKNAEDDNNSLKKPVAYLTKVINTTKQYIDTTINFEQYKFAYLTKDLTKIKDISKKQYLQAEQDRVYKIAHHHLNQQILADTIAFFDLAAAFTKSYKAIKSAHNVLDFDDLILYTRNLFSNPDSMGWVLSQLDLSLNHILVDEAQDTSPQQWDILRMMAGDFFTDGDTKESEHAIFVVGDSKQSIFGFQGADPNAFAASRQEIASQIKNNMRTICEIPLAQSFRSTSPILETVDAFFENKEIKQLTGFINNKHKCFRTGEPGLVEIYPIVSKKEHQIENKQYVQQIVVKIEKLLSTSKHSANDIMVLVQRRQPFAPLLVKELKKKNIPVAGSDRIALPDFPAIRDLLNLARFCLNNDDDYSLCCALKSPVFRLNEADILNLCTLKNNATKTQKSENKDAPEIHILNILEHERPETYNRLKEIISWSQTYGPYTFFTNVLNSNNTRSSIIAALGTQVVDPLEEFLTICLAYERTQPGTIRHFLKYFITGNSEIKRDMDTHSGVRIVTVHGSKGLEAPVVFLIDTTTTPSADKFLKIPNSEQKYDFAEPWIWTPKTSPSERFAVAQENEMKNKIAEYYRLLYVAMTRARDRLYIMGYTNNKSASPDAWHTRLWDVFGNSTTDTPTRISNDDTIA